jgi:7-cyano-7-deazaguanine synthase in queuosine biosynthesis
MALVTERVLLYSGGMDSHAAWMLTGSCWPCVYVCHGAPAEVRELETLEVLGALPGMVLHVVRGPDLHRLVASDGHIAHRNLLLLACAASAFPHASVLGYGAVAGEASPDKTPAFMRATSKALTRSENRRVRVVAPLGRMTKAQAYAAALALPGGAAQLAATWSCYDPSGPCNECQACYRRELARWRAGQRQRPPALPVLTDGPVANLRRAPLRHWPAMTRANVDSVRALLDQRRHP